MTQDRTVTTQIDPEKCTGCALCISVCPSETLAIEGKKAVVSGLESLNCGHCAAVCPAEAVRVAALPDKSTQFSTFLKKEPWSAHGSFDTRELVNLMMSRRSCRNYKNDPVPVDLLEDLVKIGITAPSGTNCQMWTFTILKERRQVLAFGNKVADFFRRLNSMAEKSWLRSLMKLLGKPELDYYYANYYERIKEKLEEHEKGGKERLFHEAPAAIVVASKNEASCPAEDALLATQNILLGAHSMGLGTCLIGFAVNAMKQDKTICRTIGIPPDETPYAVIALGYPNETYQKVTGRKPAVIRYGEKSI